MAAWALAAITATLSLGVTKNDLPGREVGKGMIACEGCFFGGGGKVAELCFFNGFTPRQLVCMCVGFELDVGCGLKTQPRGHVQWRGRDSGR